MTARSWQIYGVGFILVVVAAVVALWVSPADAQTSEARKRVVRAEPSNAPAAAPQEKAAPREPVAAPRPTPRPAPEPAPEVRPSSPVPSVPAVKPTPRPAPREPVGPREPVPAIEPRPEPVRPNPPPVVRPEVPSVPPQRTIRDDDPDRDRVRPTPPSRRPPEKVQPAPAPPPVLVPIVDFGPIDTRPEPFHCEGALVCPLDRWDDVLAWRLARETGITYWEFAYERLDGWSWYAIMRRLDIDRRLFYDVLGVSWAMQGPFRDDEVRMAVVHQVGHLVLPEFGCELPIVLPPTRQFPLPPDAVDEEIARRISHDTLWCVDTLLTLHSHLHDWGAVARALYLSPFLFETVFGLELNVHAGVVEYPRESDVRFAVLDDPGAEGQASTFGNVAKGLTLVALGVVTVMSGLF